MVLLSAAHLLLVASVLRGALQNVVRGTPPPDSDEQYGELCFCISGRCSDAGPTSQPPAVSTPPFEGFVSPEMMDFEPFYIDPLPPAEFRGGCRCSEGENQQPSKDSVRRIMVWRPDETCPSSQYLATLTDHSDVCISAWLAFFYMIPSVSLPDPRPPTTEPPGTTPTPTELSTTTLPPALEADYYYFEPTYMNDIPSLPTSASRGSTECEPCQLETDLDDVDPKDVQYLNLVVGSPPCSTSIHIFLQNASSLCYESWHFIMVLQKLVAFLVPMDDPDVTSAETEGCLCQGGSDRLPNENLKSAKIWPPRETCGSVEVIETLVDGSDECVGVPNLTVYFRELCTRIGCLFYGHTEEIPTGGMKREEKHPNSVQIGKDGQGASTLHLAGNGYAETLPIDRVPSAGWNVLPSSQVVDRVLALERSPPIVVEEPVIELLKPILVCHLCFKRGGRKSIEPNAIYSLEFVMPFQDCAAIIRVSLKYEEGFCVYESDPLFRTLLEKLREN